jgi:hypothetical protein
LALTDARQCVENGCGRAKWWYSNLLQATSSGMPPSAAAARALVGLALLALGLVRRQSTRTNDWR